MLKEVAHIGCETITGAVFYQAHLMQYWETLSAMYLQLRYFAGWLFLLGFTGNKDPSLVLLAQQGVA